MLFSVHFLRFIAAIAVVFHHSLTYFGSSITVGAAGVDVFFIISGAVIGYVTHSGESLRQFCTKRFIRVIPLYWLATLAYIGFRYLEWHLVPESEHFMRSMTLLPIFGADWHPIYFPAWSLSYELFFYSIYALLLTTFRKNINLICALLIVLISVTAIPIPGKPGMFFESRLCLEFTFGLLIATYLRAGGKFEKKIGAACISIAIIIFALNYKSNGIERVLSWGVPSFLMMIGVLSFEGAQLFKNRVSILLGDASYSIYLFHITLIELSLETAKRSGVPLTEIKNYEFLIVLGLVAVACGGGVIVHLLIERPLLSALRKLFLRTTPKSSGAVVVTAR